MCSEYGCRLPVVSPHAEAFRTARVVSRACLVPGNRQRVIVVGDVVHCEVTQAGRERVDCEERAERLGAQAICQIRSLLITRN